MGLEKKRKKSLTNTSSLIFCYCCFSFFRWGWLKNYNPVKKTLNSVMDQKWSQRLISLFFIEWKNQIRQVFLFSSIMSMFRNHREGVKWSNNASLKIVGKLTSRQSLYVLYYQFWGSWFQILISLQRRGRIKGDSFLPIYIKLVKRNFLIKMPERGSISNRPKFIFLIKIWFL